MTALLGSAGLPVDQPFTTAQARDLGVPKQQLHQLVQAGVLRHRLRQVYVAGDLRDTLELRCAMLRLVLPADAFATDRTAAWLHVGARALAPGEDLEPPPLSFFRPPTSTRMRNGLVASGQRTLLARDLMEVHGIPVTTPLRTALDLGRRQPTRDLKMAGMDAMLATGSFELDDLLGEVERFKGERGVIGLRLLAPRADGGAQSFGESALRNRWYDGGLPRPQTQVVVMRPDGDYYLVDLGLEEERFGAEYDGEAFHTEEPDVEHDSERREWLRGRADWWVEVFRKEHVFGRRQSADERLSKAWSEHRQRRRGRRTAS